MREDRNVLAVDDADSTLFVTAILAAVRLETVDLDAEIIRTIAAEVAEFANRAAFATRVEKAKVEVDADLAAAVCLDADPTSADDALLTNALTACLVATPAEEHDLTAVTAADRAPVATEATDFRGRVKAEREPTIAVDPLPAFSVFVAAPERGAIAIMPTVQLAIETPGAIVKVQVIAAAVACTKLAMTRRAGWADTEACTDFSEPANDPLAVTAFAVALGYATHATMRQPATVGVMLGVVRVPAPEV